MVIGITHGSYGRLKFHFFDTRHFCEPGPITSDAAFRAFKLRQKCIERVDADQPCIAGCGRCVDNCSAFISQSIPASMSQAGKMHRASAVKLPDNRAALTRSQTRQIGLGVLPVRHDAHHVCMRREFFQPIDCHFVLCSVRCRERFTEIPATFARSA